MTQRSTSHALAALRARISRQAQGLSIFERVIVANSAIIVLATVAGWWLTQHNAEVYHFIIDTTFIGLAALSGVVVNFILLRAAFAPLRRVLTTIHAVEQGKLSARVDVRAGDADTATLARAFNGMLDRLAEMRDEAAGLTLRGAAGCASRGRSLQSSPRPSSGAFVGRRAATAADHGASAANARRS